MSAITLWWIPDDSSTGPRWSLVARTPRGVAYALPCVRNGWLVRVRLEPEDVPTSEPLPDVATRVLAWVLRLPGATQPTTREQAEYGEWACEQRLELDRLDREAAEDDRQHGALRCYEPESERVREEASA